MTWSIDIVTVARARTPGPEVFFQRAFGDWIDIAIHVFVLRRGGTTILVDTGLIADVERLNDAMRKRKGASAGFVAVEGAADGLFSNPIDAVILTSLGPYAVGGVCAVPSDTPIFASDRGLKNLVRPEEPALTHPIPKDIGDRLIAMARRVDDRQIVLPGLEVREVGVHHPASMAVIVETADGPTVIADPIFTRRNLTERIALGAAEKVAGWHAMVRSLGADGGRFIPIHDPAPQPVLVAWACGPNSGTMSS